MVASGLRTMIAGSSSSCIAGFLRSCRLSRSSGPRHSCVRTGPAFAATGVGSRATGRATADRHRAARIDPADERRKSALGRATHPRKRAQSMKQSSRSHRPMGPVNYEVRLGSWLRKNALAREVGEKPEPVRSQAAIAAISGLVPTMFMTRVRL
jgi:hypothetical protein